MDPTIVAGIGGSLVSGILGSNSDSDARRWQRRENRTAREFAAEIHEDTQRFNENQARQTALRDRQTFREQFGLNRNEQIRQFNQSRAEYNRQFAQSRMESDRQYQRARLHSRQDLIEQRRYDASQLQRLAADAQKAGIHPLAALGGNANYSSPSGANIQAGGVGSSQPVGGSSSAYSGGSQAAYSTGTIPSLGSAPSQGSNPWGDAVMTGIQLVLGQQMAAKELEVQNSQINLNKAMTKAALVDAQSRTLIGKARSRVQAGTRGESGFETGMMGPADRDTVRQDPVTLTTTPLGVPPGHSVSREDYKITPGAQTVSIGGHSGTGLSEDAFSSEAAQTLSDASKGLGISWSWIKDTAKTMGLPEFATEVQRTLDPRGQSRSRAGQPAKSIWPKSSRGWAGTR